MKKLTAALWFAMALAACGLAGAPTGLAAEIDGITAELAEISGFRQLKKIAY